MLNSFFKRKILKEYALVQTGTLEVNSSTNLEQCDLSNDKKAYNTRIIDNPGKHL